MDAEKRMLQQVGIVLQRVDDVAAYQQQTPPPLPLPRHHVN